MITVEKNLEGEIESMNRKDFCGAGTTLISVAADGKVYPCAGLHEDEFCAGSIREQPMEIIWKESEVFKKIRSMSILDIPECKDCELKFICGGGCHVDRHYAYGRLDIPTPNCKAQQEIYWYFLSEKLKEAQ